MTHGPAYCCKNTVSQKIRPFKANSGDIFVTFCPILLLAKHTRSPGNLRYSAVYLKLQSTAQLFHHGSMGHWQ